MRTHTVALLIFWASIGLAQNAKPPELSPIEKSIVEERMREARADFVSACLTVTREAKRKQLVIFAVVPPKTALVKQSGYEIEIIYHPSLAKEHADVSGAYHHHHNQLVLNFAAAEYSAGRKELGLRLVKLIAEAQPRLQWSSPTQPLMPIQKILAGLEKDDGSMTEYLKEEATEWKDRVERYGP